MHAQNSYSSYKKTLKVQEGVNQALFGSLYHFEFETRVMLGARDFLDE